MATKESTKLNMFAVVDVNGDQLIVKNGDIILTKKLDTEKGKEYVSEKVMLIAKGENVTVGKPYIDGATVVFEVLSQTKGDKVDSFKYKAKARYRKSFGTRPLLTKIRVVDIKSK